MLTSRTLLLETSQRLSWYNSFNLSYFPRNRISSVKINAETIVSQQKANKVTAEFNPIM